MPQDDMKPTSRFNRRVAAARLVLAFERFWPLVVAAGGVVAIFVALSFAGLWLFLPYWSRPVGSLALLAALALLAVQARRARIPTRRDGLIRLDRDSGERHRPISSREDHLADPAADPATRALWSLHRARIEAAAERVKVAAPSPRLPDRDRYALRAAVVMVLIATAFVAGPDKLGRLAAAFDWRSTAPAGSGYRLYAWIDPPYYTGAPPRVLTLPGESGADVAQAIDVPVNSTIVIRSAGTGSMDVAATGALKPATAVTASSGGDRARPQPAGPIPEAIAGKPDAAAPKSDATAAAPMLSEQRFSVAGDGRLVLGHDGATVGTFAFHAIANVPPSIVVTDKPTRNARGSLTLNYKIDGQYGVIGADAEFAKPLLHGKAPGGRSLVPPPKVALALPTAPRGLGAGQTTADLSDHPWAGAEVSMTLTARDEAGSSGTSPAVTTILPARAFTQPLAKALVEQRRDLVLDPDHHDGVNVALDALTLAPDLFQVPPAIFLGLTSAQKRLTSAKTDADLLGVAELLWAMALRIEDGDLSQTEQALRALQDKLKDALARNASPDEIKQLTQALREQLDKLLAEMAEKSQQDGDPQAQDERPDPNSRSVTPKDLQAMLDRMERSARNGDMAEAQQLLDDLRNILENLKTGKKRNAGDQKSRDMNRAMGALDKMMRDQQHLRDQTFQKGAKGRKSTRNREDPQGDSGAQQPNDTQGDPSDQAENQALQQQQGTLRRQLDALQKRMREMGMESDPNLGEAGEAMQDAEKNLGQPGATDQAVEDQGRALQSLQKGAQAMANQMGPGESDQSGEGTGTAEGQGGQDGKRDPLGRQRKESNRGRDPDDGSDLGGNPGPRRAAKIREELNRRLGERTRPKDEQDYLQRLLPRY